MEKIWLQDGCYSSSSPGAISLKPTPKTPGIKDAPGSCNRWVNRPPLTEKEINLIFVRAGKNGFLSIIFFLTKTGPIMGKGDKKTKRGKVWRGSHGKTRPKKGKKTTNDQPKKES